MVPKGSTTKCGLSAFFTPCSSTSINGFDSVARRKPVEGEDGFHSRTDRFRPQFLGFLWDPLSKWFKLNGLYINGSGSHPRTFKQQPSHRHSHSRTPKKGVWECEVGPTIGFFIGEILQQKGLCVSVPSLFFGSGGGEGGTVFVRLFNVRSFFFRSFVFFIPGEP